MEELELTQSLKAQLKKLAEKYEAMGQDLSSYLDGLLYSDYLTYWDYIHLDTLLSLQAPRTAFPDEKIFILYHQVTELYFKMILNELEQAIHQDGGHKNLFLKRLNRCIRYFDHLIHSFDVMIDGMDPDQFLAFRMALLPSSGFQSGQYRMIEFYSTDFGLLVNREVREQMKGENIAKQYEHLYWKSGATELASGKKTLTLKQFEAKYGQRFIELGENMKDKNLRRKYHLYFKDQKEVIDAMKSFDHKVNVEWPLQHLRSATRYLQRDPEDIKATGGTNWQKYLPPRRQQIIFYPELWSDNELKAWGQKFRLAINATDV